MKDRLFQLLGIEPEEGSLISMLLTQSIFLGIFFGAFDISAHSLFLSIFDEKMMARAYVVSGIAGILLTGLYTWFQARIIFKNFATANLVVLSFLTLLLWLALLLYPTKVVVFSVFVMLGPLNILAMLGFWGTTGRLFSLRQGKRLFGLVDAGLIIGVIISCYAIPLLLSLNFESHNILLISTLSIFFAAIVQLLIGRKFTFIISDNEKAEKSEGISIFRENSYIRTMGIFIALSVMTAFFVQYSFMAVTREQYPLEDDMARFLGLFTGSMMIFTLLIKLLVFSYLIRNYGLRTCLALSPVLVAGFTVVAILIGMLMGYTPASTGGFIIFFLLLALSRLFSKSLKDSIESPSFKVIYQTVDEKIRFQVQSGIDGTINEISALSSGLLLAGLGALSFIKLIHFSWVLFIIICIWIIVSLRLYQEYRKSIRESLESASGGQEEDNVSSGWSNIVNRPAGISLFRSEYYRLASGDFSAIARFKNRWFINQIIDFSEISQDACLLPVLKKISEDTSVDEGIRQRGAEVIDQINETKGDPRLLKKKVAGVITDDKIIKARMTLAGTRLPQTTEILRLLRDSNLESKRNALYMIGKFRMTDMIPEVCNCFNIPGLENDVSAVIESFGSEANEALFRLFMGSSGNNSVSRSVIRLLGKNSSKETNEFMYARLWSNSRQIKEMAARKLVECGYRADPEEKDKLNQMISDILGMITWNISARVCLSRKNESLMLGVIEKETAKWNDFLFDLLSIAYDPGSIDKIQSNLESGTVGSINYALEMVDIVIDDAIKQKLVSFIDAVPDDEKLKNLHQFFPGEVPDYESLIEDILNRDYNLVNIWTKACALRAAGSINRDTFIESVVALLFSPEKLLQEEAARLIGMSGTGLFSGIKARLNKSVRTDIELIVSGKVNPQELLFEKVLFLSNLLEDVGEEELIELAGQMVYCKEFDQLRFDPSLDYLLWNTGSEYSEIRTFLIPDDNPVEKSDLLTGDSDTYFYVLPLSGLEEFGKSFPEITLKIYTYLDKKLLKITADNEIR